jgi:hypothetical protein
VRNLPVAGLRVAEEAPFDRIVDALDGAIERAVHGGDGLLVVSPVTAIEQIKKGARVNRLLTLAEPMGDGVEVLENPAPEMVSDFLDVGKHELLRRCVGVVIGVGALDRQPLIDVLFDLLEHGQKVVGIQSSRIAKVR